MSFTLPDFQPLETAIGVVFLNKSLLQHALVHRSYLNEHPEFEIGHNERLEFLGDAVLELVVTEHLYLTYPNPEGELTNWRAALVNADFLAGLCQELNTGPFLLLSRGEAKDQNSKARKYILANAFEAIIGAIYLDQGWDAAKRFIHTVVISHLPRILEERLYADPKSTFQEAAQEHVGITPAYKVLAEEGPDHAKQFTVGVYLWAECIAKGLGDSKQAAQVDAARAALELKKWK